MTTPPPEHAPLEYASSVDETLEIVRDGGGAGGGAGGITLRIPPPDAVLHTLRITTWTIGLACVGSNVVVRVLGVRASGFTSFFVRACRLPAAPGRGSAGHRRPAVVAVARRA